MDSADTVTGDGEAHPGPEGPRPDPPPTPSARLPALLAVPGALWWAANVGLWTLGVIDNGERGHRAWTAGFNHMRPWMKDTFALVGTPCWIVAVLAIGALLTVRGRAAWKPVVAVVATITVATPPLTTLAAWTYRSLA